ncbi:MAG: ornithine cyclodeaminase family protein [Bryobacteraceae bacterium]|nr:ornithine cyclodeaminase family protein [Bryobacteraceae bacterium]
MRHITEEDVRRLLPMRDAIGVVRSSFVALARGEAQNQPRRRLILSDTGSVLHQLAGRYRNYFGAKIYATNVKHGAMHFHVLLYDAENAAPLALIDANALGQIRTGAATGVATDLLAPAEVHTVGLIGSGFQAWTQLEAVLAVRPGVQDVRIYSRKAENREAFAARAAESFGVPARAAASAEEAVRGAEVVITCTFAKEPVFDDSWLHPQAHVNAAGSNQAARREVPAASVERAALIAVDSLEQARAEAGDLLLVKPAEEWQDWPLYELGALLAEQGFTRPKGVTLFKSSGLGVQDIAAAALVYERSF